VNDLKKLSIDDLITFLEARLAEQAPADTEDARKSIAAHTAMQQARHDNAIKQAQSTRKVVDECAYWVGRATVRELHPMPCLADRFEVAMTILRQLASTYAGHPRYRSEWAIPED
jgi:hypothetical protein